jgi:diaminopimelate epimerase
MKALHFHKFQGTGNDFLLVDNLEGVWKFSVDQIVRLCHRKFGIGSDGLILLERHPELDFKMNFFNPDGSQSFCGNGSRCAVRFALELGLITNRCRFSAIDGTHEAVVHEEEIRIHMHDVKEWSGTEKEFVLNTGSPHWLQVVNDVQEVNMVGVGRSVRYSDRFAPDGINVNVMETGDGAIRMRTYERGVEDETLSCGTGVTAAGLVYGILHPEAGGVKVETPGGTLRVEWKQNQGVFTDIWLIGPAQKVFEGKIEI